MLLLLLRAEEGALQLGTAQQSYICCSASVYMQCCGGSQYLLQCKRTYAVLQRVPVTMQWGSLERSGSKWNVAVEQSLLQLIFLDTAGSGCSAEG